MKKQITLFTMMAITASLFFISSCSKKETVVTDLTTNIVGTYSGRLIDTNTTPFTIIDFASTVTLTKIDDTHVKVNSGTGFSFSASIAIGNPLIYLYITQQTAGSISFEGNQQGMFDGKPYSGLYYLSNGKLNYYLDYDDSASGYSGYQSFSGTKQ